MRIVSFNIQNSLINYEEWIQTVDFLCHVVPQGVGPQTQS